ncbi:glycoside hydrolase family 43 protein [Asticcacaulis machinosus]|uniref:Glycoside hydrolase family 43 protein n=1 Tax=Asticcacaulis machinosus TaxID=2984211 RepID=A0ABT5HIZ6_9CAUL|nr:glycoside hydrolase family 43 protein [Asticcacaulis machinosus]MDC7676136.1 glycoside hydrolase family 43 protein [Asticcacaulis machinosus]
MNVFSKLAIVLGGTLLAACQTLPPPTTNVATDAALGTAAFDWFEYTGDDTLFKATLPKDKYQNPVLAGFHPDPSITRAGDDYYLINSTFGFYPGIPIFHSRDLVTWTQIGNAFSRPDMMPFSSNIGLSGSGIYAPAIRYKDGLFYIITTCVGCGGNFVITARDPAGAWSDPIWLPFIEGIDPSILFDDDGKVYVVHQRSPLNKRYDAHTAVAIMEVDPVTFAQKSEDIILVDGGDKTPWNMDYLEGPHIYKVKGEYILSAPGGGTGYFHQQLAFKSKSPLGPYTANPNNPILTQFGLPDDRPDPVTATGHADMVEDQNGQWWAVFLGTRVYDLATPPQDPGRFHTGRETFMLEVRWKDGWPVILEKGKALPARPDRPLLKADKAASIPTTGNFTVRDEFDADKLAPQWMFARTPTQGWWEAGDGSLIITARNDRFGSRGQPSFVGRRIAHMTATLTTKLSFDPAAAGDESGLMAVQNDEFYYAFGLGLNSAGQKVLRVRKREGQNEPERGITLTETPWTGAQNAPIYLRMTLNKGRIDFEASADGQRFTPVLANGDAKVLTTAAASGFVGAVAGMYAEGGDTK